MRSERVTGMFSPLRWLPLLLSLPVIAEPALRDVETGLIVDQNWELVKANCTVCHSAKLVTQQRMNRQAWRVTINWMQQKHNLWSLEGMEAPLLDYLARHYNVENGRRVRRKNLVVE